MSLFPGDPLTPMGMTFASSPTVSAATALTNFKTAIGGADNGNTAAPQAGGARNINWDGVKLDGTDFGGSPNTTVITQNKTVAIPLNRFQTRGVRFGDVYAVSGDGFTDVNSNVAGLFPAFSASNTFAMFNDNKIDMSFVLPSAATSTPVPAATKGFGAIFINVMGTGASASSIQYFSGDKDLGTFNVPPSTTAGDFEFLGELFDSAVVTRVTLTLGRGTLFTYDGSSPMGTSTNTPPNNLVVTDDFEYAEPVPASSIPPVLSGAQGTVNATPVVNAKVGTPFTGTVATFSDTAPGTTVAANYTAVINWGDGHMVNGSVVSDGHLGFNVTGTNTYTTAGRIPISVDVAKFDTTGAGTSISLTNTAIVASTDTTTTLTVAPTTGVAGQSITLTAKVVGTTSNIPGGMVAFKDGSTILGVAALDNTGTATLTTSSLTSGNHSLTASYLGNGNFNSGDSSAVSVTISSNITSQVTVNRGPVKRRRGGGFVQIVTLVNTGTDVPGPIFFVFDGLSSKVKLIGATGVTVNQAPLGSPYITGLGSASTFAKGQQITLNLTFNARKANLINYTPRVLAGLTP